MTQKKATRVVTFGTFDLLHIGHLNILRRARELGSELFVGLSSDELNLMKKKRLPIYSYEERKEILESLRCVDFVFKEESLEKKLDYLREHKADVLVMGNDWEGRFDFCKEVCRVVYLPRTPSISTTELIEVIVKRSG